MKTRVAIDITLAVTLLACFVLFAAPASAAARIDGIAPTAAERGAEVELRGGGFGAKNVSVWVGGVSAQVLSATGNRVRFLVPATAPLGSTTVEAANPGGKRASIPFTVLGSGTPPSFDGTVGLVLDTPGAKTANVGRDGGTVTAGTLTLEVPAGALSQDTQITVTPLFGLNGSPLDGSFVGGAKLEPEGLRFLKPAVLSMPLPAGVQKKDVLGFASAGNGTNLHLVPPGVEGGTIAIDVWHFSSGGASSGGAGAAGAMQGYQPTSAESRALQRIAAAIPGCEAELASLIFNGPACTHLEQETVRALFEWYANAVKPGLDQAVGAPSFHLEAALQEWLSWAATVNAKLNGELNNELGQAHAVASDAVAEFARRRLDNCTGTTLASQLRDVARVADYVDAGAVDLAAEGVPADLLRECAHLKIEVLAFPKVAALLHANTLRGKVTVDVKSGADRTDVPFTLTMDGAVISAGADGSFQTTITPTATPVDVELEATANDVNLQNTSFKDAVGVGGPARDRIELAPLGIVGTVGPGSTVPLRVLLAGDDMSNALVTYGISGVGQISPTSGLTNADGETPAFDYSVPDDSDAGTGTVTATFGSDQDSHTFTVKLFELTIKRGVVLFPGDFGGPVDGTGITAQEYDADEDVICCVPTVLASDSAPPVSLALAGTTLRVHEPSLNTLGIDVTGSAVSSPSNDASLSIYPITQVELSSTKALMVRADVNPGWHLDGNVGIRVTIRETGETMACGGSFGTHLTCASRTFALVAGTHTVDVEAKVGDGNSGVTSVSGRMVTLTVQVVQ